jgi:peptidoglycan/LPS O-acetylase OafA/YrhL
LRVIVPIQRVSDNPDRLRWLDLGKGVGIMLVVFGHVVAGPPPAGHDWYVVAKYAIYGFHMAFFMLLAGFAAMRFQTQVRSFKDVLAQWGKRFCRLVIPFLLFAALIYFGKKYAAGIVPLDNPLAPQTRLLNLFLDPLNGPAAMLWFAWVLFLLCLLSPGLGLLGHRGWTGWMLGAVLLTSCMHLGVIKATGVAWLVIEFLPYFLWGGWLAASEAAMRRTLRAAIWCSPICILILWLYAKGDIPGNFRWLVPWSVMPPLLGFIHFLVRFDGLKWLGKLGRYSFPIYLMNTLFIFLAKFALSKKIDWNGIGFWIFLPVLMACGLGLPILTQRFIIERTPFLRVLVRK